MAKDPFQMSHFLDPYTGKVTRRYTYKRKPCSSIMLNSRRATQLAGYTLIEKDLRSCLAWLDEIEQRHDLSNIPQGATHHHGADRANYTIIKGLFVALLTFYAKCFTRCEGRRIKIDRKQLGAEFHGHHDHLMMLRHNFAAHSGSELVERARVVAVYSPPKKAHFAVKVARELEQPDVLVSTEGEASTRGLIQHVQQLVSAKIDELAHAIQHEEAVDAVVAALKGKH